MFKDRKKFQDELDRYHDVNYASKVEIDCAKAKEMKKELFAHQETISIMSQEKEAQNKFYKTRKNKEIEKVVALENKVKSFIKPEFLKKAQRANPHLYDIGFYNDNLALMLAHESDGTIRLAQEIVKCERLEKELSKSNTTSKSFEALQQHAIDLELALQQCQEQIKNDKAFKENQSKVFMKEREQYFEIQDLKAQLQDKGIAIRVIPATSVSRPQIKSNRLEDRVMHNNSEGKKQQVEDNHRNFKFSNNKTSVTTCNDSLNAKTSNVNFVFVTCEKCVLNDNHDMCVLHYINDVNSRTKMPIAVPISTREPKRTVNQSVATPLKRTIASESTNQKPRIKIRKQYE
ncbi:hypothetical protein Tco_0864060 [Tanacetum coccineum]